MNINMEILFTITGLVKDWIREQGPPGTVSPIRRLFAGQLSHEEVMELYQDYRTALGMIKDHCDALLNDNDWKGNLK